MIASVPEFQKYTNVFLEDTALQESYILSAENVISDYLGYSPTEKLLNPSTGELEDITEAVDILRLTCLRIAALLQTEADSNIGVNSKSWGEGGARVFTNYTSFDKFLSPLAKYRLIRI